MEHSKDKTFVEAWTKSLMDEMTAKQPSLKPSVSVESFGEGDSQRFWPRLTIYVHQLPQHYLLDLSFFQSGEYARLMSLSHQWRNILEEGAVLKKGDKQHQIYTFSDLWDHLMNDSRRGVTVQRYKGLGEMNPDQLWETTMDPENRRMLRVSIHDAIEADHMFSCLMGDDVEPRRIFIEDNALSVTNLDA